MPTQKNAKKEADIQQSKTTVFSHCHFVPGVLPYMGYIGMCGPKGYGFSAVLVINRVSILADLGHFFIIMAKKINKSPSQIMFTVI